ncbi:DNA/RNA nuclease SfsA [Dehalobacter sp.]|uniref:DNA/RNA nuclease SfsA n=1 Tax=Dehalobacter sp. TaxID=1962289 RepID=UPI00258AE4C5|nr:DNA/RNA nuclease SfsA [Dehalobacter sp.]MDJ0306799.1 DNA/RNA nuclease SfsA [Dehalobacter sp.]
MKKYAKFIEGLFIREGKNRFIGFVLINEQIHECYVPNSSKMEKYIQLTNKVVLLTENGDSKSRTKFSLFAVRHKDKYVLLDLRLVNECLEQAIQSGFVYPDNNYSVVREKYIGGYKADLCLADNAEQIIVEAKGVISLEARINFPGIFSRRFENQLTRLLSMLRDGWSISYIIVSMSPFIEQIQLNSPSKQFNKLFFDCLDQGMDLKQLSLELCDGKIGYRSRNPELILK